MDGIVTIENGGTATTYPVIDTVFQKNTNFFMVTNYDTKTLLLGTPPDEEVCLWILMMCGVLL